MLNEGKTLKKLQTSDAIELTENRKQTQCWRKGSWWYSQRQKYNNTRSCKNRILAVSYHCLHNQSKFDNSIKL